MLSTYITDPFYTNLFTIAGAIGTASTTGTTGTTNARSSALADALADSIRMKAEARKALVENKHGGATPQSSPVPAKTKSFAYTNIEIS
jgi:hypothetical protein